MVPVYKDSDYIWIELHIQVLIYMFLPILNQNNLVSTSHICVSPAANYCGITSYPSTITLKYNPPFYLGFNYPLFS